MGWNVLYFVGAGEVDVCDGLYHYVGSDEVDILDGWFHYVREFDGDISGGLHYLHCTALIKKSSTFKDQAFCLLSTAVSTEKVPSYSKQAVAQQQEPRSGSSHWE